MNHTRSRKIGWAGPLALTLLISGAAACSDDTVPTKYDFGPLDSGADSGVDGATDTTPDSPPPTITKLTILYTTDMHDHLMGYGPEADFTPATTGDDSTIGGFARLAAQIKLERSAGNTTPVLLLDGGDFSMGSAFRLLGLSKAPTLTLMQELGYDAMTLGNHEFDWTCDALAGFLGTATTGGFKVPILASNLKFDSSKTGDDKLEALVTAGVIKTKLVKTLSNGLKVGFLGLLGGEAAAVAPLKAPLQVIGEDDWKNVYPEVTKVVKDLRDNDKVDLVIALSHSGTKPSGKGDDEELARNVPGIDVIISGHTHETLTKAAAVQDTAKTWTTLIVQSGAYTRSLGKLELTLKDGKIDTNTVTILKLDDKVKADAATQTKIDGFIADIDTALAGAGLSYKQVLAEVAFDLKVVDYKESNLGDLVTDAYITVHDALNPTEKADVAFETPGVIRDDILQGKTGKIWFADLFRALPLGIGPDQNPGYPLVSFYITGKELKAGMELCNLAEGTLKNNDYYPQVSGVEVEYTKNAIPTTSVTSIKVGGAAVNLTDTTTCYKIVTSLYVAELLGQLAKVSGGVLKVEAKEKDCSTKITDLTTRIIDADPTTAGVQELKAWQALLKYVTALPDTTSNSIPDVPATYATPQNRIIAQ